LDIARRSKQKFDPIDQILIFNLLSSISSRSQSIDSMRYEHQRPLFPMRNVM